MGQNIPGEGNASDDLKLFKDAVDELEGSSKKEEDVGEEEKKDTEDQLKEIKAHQETLTSEASPLVYLKRKELELKGGLLKAEKEAETLVADARRKATEIKKDAEETAAVESKKYYAREIEKAKKKAEEIRNSVEEDRKRIVTAGQEKIDEAAEIIVKEITLIE